MKPGLKIGTQASVEDMVTDGMQAGFGGQVVHAVYGTAAMVYHMEWAARRVITPFLEDDEDGIGTGVEVRHLHPAPVGATVVATATCMGMEGSVIVCDVVVRCNDQILGEGRVQQRIVRKDMLRERFPDLWGAPDTIERDVDNDGQNDRLV